MSSYLPVTSESPGNLNEDIELEEILSFVMEHCKSPWRPTFASAEEAEEYLGMPFQSEEGGQSSVQEYSTCVQEFPTLLPCTERDEESKLVNQNPPATGEMPERTEVKIESPFRESSTNPEESKDIPEHSVVAGHVSSTTEPSLAVPVARVRQFGRRGRPKKIVPPDQDFAVKPQNNHRLVEKQYRARNTDAFIGLRQALKADPLLKKSATLKCGIERLRQLRKVVIDLIKDKPMLKNLPELQTGNFAAYLKLHWPDFDSWNSPAN